MATTIAIMDRPGMDRPTDVIVVARPKRRQLLWVPRDLWSERVGDRVNEAFRQGGPSLLRDTLAEHGIGAGTIVCLDRSLVAGILARVDVLMPIREPMEFWYPLGPERDLEEGRRPIRFEPPVERLSGERVHQWIGARYPTGAPGTPIPRLPDLHRIRRQQELVAVLVGGGFDFAAAAEAIEAAGPQQARIEGDGWRDDLAAIDPGWSFETFGPVVPVTIDGKAVLAPGSVRPRHE